MKILSLKYLILVSTLLILSACSVKKYIPEEKTLYTGGTIAFNDTIEIKNRNGLRTMLQGLLKPKPNAKFLGMRPKLYFYYKGQKEKSGFINKFLAKKLGQEPVYFEDVDINSTEDLILNRLNNNGFFGSRVTSEIKKDSAAQTTTVDYTVKTAKPYRIEKYVVERDTLDSLALYNKIENSLADTHLQKNMRFNLDAMKAERVRIDNYLKESGYYNFNGDFLIFEADTNRYDKRRFDLFLNLKSKVPSKSLVPYVIDEVNVYPNYSVEEKKDFKDTTIVDSIKFVQDQVYFKPKRLAPYLLIKPGDKYNPTKSKYTSRRLSNIGTYKFVNIEYVEKDSVTKNGQRRLDANIYLSPLNKRSIRLELQGVTKSNNFAGPGLGVTYTNRNLFKGGELLRINTSFGYEKQFGSGISEGSTSLQLGAKSSLTFPRLLFPIDLHSRFKYSIPKTKIEVGADYLNRTQLYRLQSYSTSFGYLWAANKYVTHQLNPININYVSLGKTSDKFEQVLEENPFLRQSFEQQFIAGLTYSFTYNELVDQSKVGSLYFNLNFDIAGNTVSLFGKESNDGAKTFLGLKYAQYAKTDVDLRYHLKLDNKGQVLVGRLFGGLGLPYANSDALPFVKQYFSGGPYSVRAFKIRGLGPGTYEPENAESGYFDQAGDIRLEANVEYRFPIVQYLNGAIFADAGNVWLTQENEALPGGKFTSDFYKQLGIGTGFGLRVDIQGFVIRFDLAAPLKEPNSSWKFDYDSPVFNFAIGYPF
ncbi:translocation and assembly module lipoprotein TamL [Haloflavibacter putidus]|uniref:BamA/TamA family outer membrane protein n=1 Tax=Haloflavibacter putidus TaxID=2576776 RepID=A0A507ZQX8_9FLAO|nr:BamA/TamA family outer membrane protein [Haloflavibacter putidus]TQD39021.1 BamA/TamA family outer membrane protein [Haloflavibacter putidus]